MLSTLLLSLLSVSVALQGPGAPAFSNVHAAPKTTTERPVVPERVPLAILYEDEDLLVIDKAAGMVVQDVPGSVERAVVAHLDATGACRWDTPAWAATWGGARAFEGVVHRLDKGTSGCMAVAKHPRAARALRAAFRERRVGKTYLALAVGLPQRAAPTTSADGKGEASPSPKSPTTTLEELEVDPQQMCLVNSINACGKDTGRALQLLDGAIRPGVACFSAALAVCKRAGEVGAALSLLNSMAARGVAPNAACFRTVIALCALEAPPRWQTTVELVDEMEARGLPRDAHCVCSAMSACGRAAQLAAALDLFASVEKDYDAAGSATPAEGGPVVSDRGRLEVRLGPGAYRACLRSAISACERCGAAEGAAPELLAERRRVIALNGDEHSPSTAAAATTDWAALMSVPIVVDAPIGKGASRFWGVVPLAEGGRPARSSMTPLAFDGTLSLNKVTIETGRTHQIRVHMSAVLGAPLVGDRAYGASESRRQRRGGGMATSQPVRRAMLHAAELVLPHPTSGETLTLQCPPPADFSVLSDRVLCGDSSGVASRLAMSEVWASERDWLLGAP